MTKVKILKNWEDGEGYTVPFPIGLILENKENNPGSFKAIDGSKFSLYVGSYMGSREEHLNEMVIEGKIEILEK